NQVELVAVRAVFDDVPHHLLVQSKRREFAGSGIIQVKEVLGVEHLRGAASGSQAPNYSSRSRRGSNTKGKQNSFFHEKSPFTISCAPWMCQAIPWMSKHFSSTQTVPGLCGGIHSGALKPKIPRLRFAMRGMTEQLVICARDDRALVICARDDRAVVVPRLRSLSSG